MDRRSRVSGVLGLPLLSALVLGVLVCDWASAATAAFDAEVATKAYLSTISVAARARSDAYFEGGYWLLLWDLLVTLGVCWLLLVTGISASMRRIAQRVTGLRFVHSVIYAAQYFVVVAVLTLPWLGYESFWREHQYGMSNLTALGWLGEQAKGLGITLVLGSLAVAVIYALIRRLPGSWWLWGAVVSFVFMGALATLAPPLLEPVFNHFYPLPDSPLKHDILSMAKANGIPANQVYAYDASKQTTKISAHVSGLLGTVQISLNDNLLNRSSPEEIKAVMAHEMGHYVLNHGYKGLVWSGLENFGGFALLFFVYQRLQRRYGQAWGIEGPEDVAGFPVFVAIFSLYSFLLIPLDNTVTRTMETEADMFGLNAARQPDGFAAAAVQLSEYRKMTPGPWEEIIFYDHPSGWNRIHRSMVWKAQNLPSAQVCP